MMLTLRRAPDRTRALLRGVLLFLAAGLLLASFRQEWWSLTMYAPQYPQGLTVSSSLVEMQGDVKELDTLNHYIGMMPLGEAAQLERSLVPYTVPAIILLALLSVLTRGILSWVLTAPLLAFPAIFLADLFGWLYYAGQNLDPKAPMSSSIPPFVPTILGEGKIAQFRTIGTLHTGFYLAVAAALLVGLSAWLSRGPRLPEEG